MDLQRKNLKFHQSQTEIIKKVVCWWILSRRDIEVKPKGNLARLADSICSQMLATPW